MKPKRIRVAPLLILSILCFSYVIGCKKSDPDPAPVSDLAAIVIGNYTMIFLNQNNPVGGPVLATRTGNVVVTRDGTALEKVKFNVIITRNTLENGLVSTITSAEDKLITLKEAGKAVDLYDGPAKLGSWINDTINVTFYSFNGQTVNSKTIDFAASK